MAKLMDLHTAAAHVGCSTWTLRDLIWRGELAFIKLGKKHWVTAEDIDAFIERARRFEGQDAGKAKDRTRKPS